MARGRAPAGVTLHRFFLPPGALRGSGVEFPDAVGHQLRRVLRMRTGDQIQVLDGSGLEYLVQLTDVGAQVSGEILRCAKNVHETARPIVLYMGLLKAAKIETVIQHCTETGVAQIVPLVTARSVASEPSDARQRRFEAISREAAEQSGRGIIPRVCPPLPLREALQCATDAGPVLFLYEDATETYLINADLQPDAGPVSIFVGPEGGFQSEEVAQAVGMGAQSISLGPRILRAETAAIVGCALVAARLDVTHP